MRRWVALLNLVALAALGIVAGGARADTSPPFQNDPLGPITNVTGHWKRYQAAPAFCIKPSVKEYTPGGTGATATGRDPVCAWSGFPASATGLVKIQVQAPLLCDRCVRLFIDFSKITGSGAPADGEAEGHAYYHLDSINDGYTVDPVAHSPNTKNFTNDKLVAPAGSPQEQIIGTFDHHAIAYTTDTANFVHTKSQGPYYTGPSYPNRRGRTIRGVYLDVNIDRATRLPNPLLNAIGYSAGFNSGGTCPNDADAFYGGCVDWWGLSSTIVDPFND